MGSKGTSIGDLTPLMGAQSSMPDLSISKEARVETEVSAASQRERLPSTFLPKDASLQRLEVGFQAIKSRNQTKNISEVPLTQRNPIHQRF
jgi:hypothetical protein